jgi:transcriptional regulator with XRE-family HTH domain
MKSKTEPLTLGEKLRKLRKEKGYSQEYFAECLKLSQKKVSNMENDKNTISLETLKKISKEFNVDLIELLSDVKGLIQNNTANDTSTINGIVNNTDSEELIIQFKERIEDFKNQLKTKDDLIDQLKNKVSQLEKLL